MTILGKKNVRRKPPPYIMGAGESKVSNFLQRENRNSKMEKWNTKKATKGCV
jgi:hypothetical protein